jgi:hypothetical protein
VADVVLVAGETAAILTRNAMPVLDGDIGRVRVIGPQDLPKDHKEVEESAFL